MLAMFEELGTAIDALDIPADGAWLAAVVGLRDRLDARISDAVATHDRAGLWELDGATSMTAWLADRAAMPRPRAAATVSRARKLAHLPVTAAAWRDRGAVEWSGRSHSRRRLDRDDLNRRARGNRGNRAGRRHACRFLDLVHQAVEPKHAGDLFVGVVPVGIDHNALIRGRHLERLRFARPS